MNAQDPSTPVGESTGSRIAPGPDGDNGRHPFSLSIAGWASLLGGAVLLSLFAYFVLLVVPPMTRPSPYFEQLTRQLAEQQAASETESGTQESDKLSVDLAVILEYTNADIRALNVQVAFSLVGGLALTVIGILLFAVEARDAIKLSGSHQDWRWTLSATAPGTVALILGTVVMLTGIAKETRRPLDASIRRPEGVEYKQEQKLLPGARAEPPGTGTGNPARSPTTPGNPEGTTPQRPGTEAGDPSV